MKIPKRYQNFLKEHPAVASAYEALGTSVHSAGPLDAKTRELVKIGISIGARMEGAVHSHVRKALENGAREDEIRHVALLTLPTLGFPSIMASLSWLEDVLKKPQRKKK